MSDSTSQLNQVSTSATLREATINENFNQTSAAAQYARDDVTTSGLTWGFQGGRFGGTLVADGTVALTASNTNYIVVNRTTFAVSASTATTNWNDALNYGRAYLAVCGGSTITSHEDHREGPGGILYGSSTPGGSAGITINAQTGTSYTVLSGDLAKCVTFSNAAAIAVTLPQATGSFGATWYADFENKGVGAATITPTTSTINGLATLVLTTGQSVRLISDGTNYQMVFLPPGVGVNAQTGTSYTYLNGDRAKLVTHTNAAAIAGALPQATGAFGAGWHMWVQNRGAGTLTITPTTSTVDGAATLVLATGEGAFIVSDGTNYFTERGTGTVSLANTNVWSKNQSVPFSALTDGANIAVNSALSNNFSVTLGGNRTLDNPSNLTDGMILNFYIEQDGTGTRTLAFGSKYKFAGGVSTISTAASARDFISCCYNLTDDILLCNLTKAYA